MSKLMFGHDAEVFVVAPDGHPVPPVVILPQPKVVSLVTARGGYNRDGMAFEINPTPSGVAKVVAENTMILLAEGGKMLKEYGLSLAKELGIDISHIPAEERALVPSDAFELGCDPDFSAYTGAINKVTVDPSRYLKRFAGGHISMQLPQTLPFSEVCELVKLFDATAGLYSIRWGDKYSKERRNTYGKAGAFRWKDRMRIVEYRTPDAGWLWHDGYVKMTELMSKAWGMFDNGFRVQSPQRIVEAINTCHLALAKEILESYGIF